MAKKKNSSLIPAERIERAIVFLRGQKVMLDALRQLMEAPQTEPPEVGYHMLIDTK